MAARLVLDELDLNLSSLATALFIFVFIVISRGRDARTFGATGVIAVACKVIGRGGMVDVRIGDISHFLRVAIDLIVDGFDENGRLRKVPNRVSGWMERVKRKRFDVLRKMTDGTYAISNEMAVVD